MASSEPFTMVSLLHPNDWMYVADDITVIVTAEQVTIDYKSTGTADVVARRLKDGSQ